MDVGKFLYERTKKERESRKSQTKIEIKEIRLRPKTNEHHRGFKVRDAHRWLLDGIKVKVTVRFRGREITYPELEGKVMTMVLNPSKPAKKKVSETEEKPEAKPAAKPEKEKIISE